MSLLQLDPYALVELRENHSCLISLPEILFDLDNPGHYLRRLKTVALTFPCVVGPYTSVSATLTLLNNQIRTSTDTSAGYPRTSFGHSLHRRSWRLDRDRHQRRPQRQRPVRAAPRGRALPALRGRWCHLDVAPDAQQRLPPVRLLDDQRRRAAPAVHGARRGSRSSRAAAASSARQQLNDDRARGKPQGSLPALQRPARLPDELGTVPQPCTGQPTRSSRWPCRRNGSPSSPAEWT